MALDKVFTGLDVQSVDQGRVALEQVLLVVAVKVGGQGLLIPFADLLTAYTVMQLLNATPATKTPSESQSRLCIYFQDRVKLDVTDAFGRKGSSTEGYEEV